LYIILCYQPKFRDALSFIGVPHQQLLYVQMFIAEKFRLSSEKATNINVASEKYTMSR
jgi:hypothetical protein